MSLARTNASTSDRGQSASFVTGRWYRRGGWNAQNDQPRYIRDIALWLDDPKQVHPCNGESAYKGLEILMAICRSAIERRPIQLPMEPGEPEMEQLARIL